MSDAKRFTVDQEMRCADLGAQPLGPRDERSRLWDEAAATQFDFVVIGGGVIGACIYHRLCSLGHRVLLVDRGDFGSGTSQASGMMVWGGLLYLRNLDLRAVYGFSRSRDALIDELQEWVRPAAFRYIPSREAGRSRPLLFTAFYLYWLLGLCRRSQPALESRFREAGLVRPSPALGSLRFEEGLLRTSDARFVLHWIVPHRSGGRVPLNYCEAIAGEYACSAKLWHVEIKDVLRDRETTV